MSVIFGLLLLLGIVLVILIALGYFLPTSFIIDEAVLVNAEANEVFPYINVLENWKEWTIWNEDNGVEMTYAGPASGAGAIQTWQGNQIQATMKVQRNQIPSQLEFMLDLEQGKFLVKGTMILDASMPMMTQVAWRSELSVQQAFNPVHRYQAYFLKNYLASSMQASLNGLSSLFPEEDELPTNIN